VLVVLVVLVQLHAQLVLPLEQLVLVESQLVLLIPAMS
jgi:hypothetical protein